LTLDKKEHSVTIKCSVFIATSLDGFIARSDGSIDWLNAANAVVPPGEDCGYKAFMSTVDTLVMGRNTFEQVLTFGEWPYGDTPVVVMSHRASPLPSNAPQTVTSSQETPTDLVARLCAQGKRHLYIDGGITIQSFLSERLINTLTITVIPILLGAGKPLFGSLPSDIPLSHVATRVYGFGFVQHKYRVQSEAGYEPT
jgi:dihydrofolate reductase